MKHFLKRGWIEESIKLFFNRFSLFLAQNTIIFLNFDFSRIRDPILNNVKMKVQIITKKTQNQRNKIIRASKVVRHFLQNTPKFLKNKIFDGTRFIYLNDLIYSIDLICLIDSKIQLV